MKNAIKVKTLVKTSDKIVDQLLFDNNYELATLGQNFSSKHIKKQIINEFYKNISICNEYSCNLIRVLIQYSGLSIEISLTNQNNLIFEDFTIKFIQLLKPIVSEFAKKIKDDFLQ